MKGRVAALGQISGRAAAALVVDGKLEDFLIDPQNDKCPAPGTIFRAICDRPFKGQGGMMLRLPSGSAFLRTAKGLRPGQPLIVQVTGYSEAGKAIPVTSRILFKSKYAIVTPGAPGINVSRSIKDDDIRVRLLDIADEMFGDAKDAGLIIRSLAADASDDDVADDIAAMAGLASAVLSDADGTSAELLVDGADPHTLAWRDWGSVDAFADYEDAFSDYGIPDLIETLTMAHVPLPGSAYAFIEPTRALVAVDVNTGNDTSPAAGLKANIALARELPRQLRCRGIGGQVTIDFAPFAKKDRRQLEQVLKSAFRTDPIETALVGWTPLGHFEIQRKRGRLPVEEYLQK